MRPQAVAVPLNISLKINERQGRIQQPDYERQLVEAAIAACEQSVRQLTEESRAHPSDTRVGLKSPPAPAPNHALFTDIRLGRNPDGIAFTQPKQKRHPRDSRGCRFYYIKWS